MGPGDHPKISFIIPTLNAAAILENCLASIVQQSYPRERYEIVIADAYSKDATRQIANRYGAIILDDNGRNMEEGKRLALSHATGEYIVFMDADNELTHPDFLELAVEGLAKNPQALGVESYYLPSAKMSSFCAYVTHLIPAWRACFATDSNTAGLSGTQTIALTFCWIHVRRVAVSPNMRNALACCVSRRAARS